MDLERIALDALHQAEMFDDGDLEAMARAYYGLARVTCGHVRDGMEALDEALTESVSGEVVEYSTTGEVYCVLLSACELVGDLARLEN
jgi:hypothetical protein